MAELKVERAIDQRLKLDMREMRARQAAMQIIDVLRPCIPDAACHEALHRLQRAFQETNTTLIQVDPRWEAYTELQLQEAFLNTHPYVIAHPELKQEIIP